MSDKYGALSYLKFTFQDSFGAIDTTSSQAFPFISESFKLNIDRLNKPAKSRFTKSRSAQGKRGNAGSIELLGSPTILAYGLKSALGHNYSTYSGGVFEHVFGVPEYDWNCYVPLQPVTVELNDGESANSIFYQDTIGNGIQIGIEVGNFVIVGLDVLGITQKEDAKTALNYLVEKPFKWDQASISFDNIANPDFESVNLSISNNLEQIYTLSTTHNPQRIKRTAQVNIELTGTAVFENDSNFNAFLSNIEYDFNLSMANADNSIFEVSIPNLQIIDYNSNRTEYGLIRLDFTAEAFFNQGSSSVIGVSIQSSYGLFPAPFILGDDFFGLLDKTYNILT